MQWIRHYWEALRTSYWFVPAVMTALAAVLAIFAVRADENIQEHWLIKADWIYTGSAEGARQLLAAVAGSMITVAGVVFSINVVALSMASSQFGPRLLRNFMRDRGNQIVLGTFIATFVYCLLVLRTVRGQEGSIFVPHLAVTGAVLLALASVGVLIYFIHHAAVSVQAPVVVANVGRELQESIDTLFPENLGDAPHEAEPDCDDVIPENFETEARPVPAGSDGYLQVIDDKKLMELAAEHELLIRVVHRPGHFVIECGPLALVWPAPDDEMIQRIRDCFAIGAQPTPTQDAEYVINQLVEVAVRALSPGINDPFTATACIDRLGAALARLGGRKIPSPFRYEDQGRLRIIAYPLTFADMADAAFRQIRQNGRSHAAVLIRMLETFAVVWKHARRPEDKAALLSHAALVRQCADDLPQAADRNDVYARCEAIRRLDGESTATGMAVHSETSSTQLT